MDQPEDDVLTEDEFLVGDKVATAIFMKLPVDTVLQVFREAVIDQEAKKNRCAEEAAVIGGAWATLRKRNEAHRFKEFFSDENIAVRYEAASALMRDDPEAEKELETILALKDGDISTLAGMKLGLLHSERERPKQHGSSKPIHRPPEKTVSQKVTRRKDKERIAHEQQVATTKEVQETCRMVLRLLPSDKIVELLRESIILCENDRLEMAKAGQESRPEALILLEKVFRWTNIWIAGQDVLEERGDYDLIKAWQDDPLDIVRGRLRGWLAYREKMKK